MWELDYKESWAPKNWCFWTVVLEKTLESPLVCKQIQPVHPKGDQSWVFTGRTDVEAETAILWPPDAKSWLFGKDSDAGRDWGQEKKGMREDEMAWWHHQLKLKLSQTPGVWVNSGSWWWTGRPGVLQFMGSQRVGHDWATELNWTGPPWWLSGKRFHLPMQETQEMLVRSLGLVHSLELEIAILSTVLAWKIPLTEKLGRLQSMGLQRVGLDWACTYSIKDSRLGCGDEVKRKVEKVRKKCEQLDWSLLTDFITSRVRGT